MLNWTEKSFEQVGVDNQIKSRFRRQLSDKGKYFLKRCFLYSSDFVPKQGCDDALFVADYQKNSKKLKNKQKIAINSVFL